MKRICLYAVFVFLLLSCDSPKQNDVSFKLMGQVNNLDGAEVILSQNEKVFDKTIIKDDTFSLSGKLPDKQLYTITFRSAKPYFFKGFKYGGGVQLKQVFVERGCSYLIKASAGDNISNVKIEIITNSKIQAQFEEFDRISKKKYQEVREHLQQISLKRDLFLEQGNDIGYTMYTDSLRLNEQELLRLNNKILHEYTLERPNSMVSLYLLSKASDISRNFGFYQHISKQLNEQYSAHPYAILFKKKLHTAENMKAGKINLKFTGKNESGNEFNLKDFAKSKLIVFDFWATWCAPCMKEIPASLALEKEFSSQGVSYIFMSYDFNKKFWARNTFSLGLTNSFILDNKNKQILSEDLDISTIPRYVIVNNKGDVLASDAPAPSSPELRKLIKGLLSAD